MYFLETMSGAAVNVSNVKRMSPTQVKKLDANYAPCAWGEGNLVGVKLEMSDGLVELHYVGEGATPEGALLRIQRRINEIVDAVNGIGLAAVFDKFEAQQKL